MANVMTESSSPKWCFIALITKTSHLIPWLPRSLHIFWFWTQITTAVSFAFQAGTRTSVTLLGVLAEVNVITCLETVLHDRWGHEKHYSKSLRLQGTEQRSCIWKCWVILKYNRLISSCHSSYAITALDVFKWPGWNFQLGIIQSPIYHENEKINPFETISIYIFDCTCRLDA